MKLATVLGTRPEIIRLSRVIEKLDAHCDHTLIHTGQNYERGLSGVFFDELKVRAPDHQLAVRGSAAEQVGQILAGCDALFESVAPDRVLILGDTNSGMAAYVAKRRGIPVFHMEAGNRCFDDRVPEEVNRRVIDQCSDVLMPYTERSRQNLLREGFPSDRVFVTGNPMGEVLAHYRPSIDASTILDQLAVAPDRFFLVTLHRAENVDDPDRLRRLVTALDRIAETYRMPVLVSTHPRTRARLKEMPGGHDASPDGSGKDGSDTDRDAGVRFLDPFGFFDFVKLEMTARCVLSDSGTVQEECAILGRPNVTLRDVTERPETVECGSNILAGSEPEDILRCTALAMSQKGTWQAPPEYLRTEISSTAARILIGHMNWTWRGSTK